MRTGRLPLRQATVRFSYGSRCVFRESRPASSCRVQEFDPSKSHFDGSNCDFDGSKWDFDGSKCGFAPACWELLRGEAGGLPGCCSRNSLCKQFRASREIVIFRGLGMKFRLLLAAFPCIFLSLPSAKTGRGLAKPNRKLCFHLPLRSPFTIFGCKMFLRCNHIFNNKKE